MGGGSKYFIMDGEGEFSCWKMQLQRSVLALSQSSKELPRISRQDRQALICLSRHTAHRRAFLQRNWQVLTTGASSECEFISCFASTPSLWAGCSQPPLDAGLSFPKREIFCSHISAAPEILKAAATYPSSCPLFSRISNRRRGVSFCQALQLPGMLPRCHHLIQRQPEQLLLQPGQGQALSLLTHPSTKLCTAQPQPFPASP